MPTARCANEWQTSILIDGYLYGFDNVGSAGPSDASHLHRSGHGKTHVAATHFGKGNLTYADGKLLISTFKGEFVVVRASEKGFEELGRMAVVESTPASAVAGRWPRLSSRRSRNRLSRRSRQVSKHWPEA